MNSKGRNPVFPTVSAQGTRRSVMSHDEKAPKKGNATLVVVEKDAPAMVAGAVVRSSDTTTVQTPSDIILSPDKKRRRSVWGRLRRDLFVRVGRAYVALLYHMWPLLKGVLRPRFVFAVYGNRRQQGRFFSEKFTKKARGAFPIGFLFFRGRWGMYCATPRTEEELSAKPGLAFGYLSAIKREFPLTRYFALAGRLPSFAHKATDEPVKEPFSDGSLGTRYVMRRTVMALAKRLGRSLADLVICVPGGAGYIGEQVVRDLSDHCKGVVALDPRYSDRRQDGRVLYTARPEDVGIADAVIVLTSTGKDVEWLIPYLRPGMVVADDTHPPVPKELRQLIVDGGAVIYKTVAEAERGIRMVPALPGFERSNVPGCLLQCVVEMYAGRQFGDDFATFCAVAVELGFDAKLIDHPER